MRSKCFYESPRAIEPRITALEDVLSILSFFKRLSSLGLSRTAKMSCLMDWPSVWWFEYFRKREESMPLPCWLNDNEGFVKPKRADEDNLKRDGGAKKMRFSNRWERTSSTLPKHCSVTINLQCYSSNVFYFLPSLKSILFAFYVKRRRKCRETVNSVFFPETTRS